MRVFCPITRIIRQDRGAKMTHDFMMTTRASGKILNAIKIKTNQPLESNVMTVVEFHSEAGEIQ